MRPMFFASGFFRQISSMPTNLFTFWHLCSRRMRSTVMEVSVQYTSHSSSSPTSTQCSERTTSRTTSYLQLARLIATGYGFFFLRRTVCGVGALDAGAGEAGGGAAAGAEAGAP